MVSGHFTAGLQVPLKYVTVQLGKEEKLVL